MFTIENLHDNVIRLAKENPDFVYESHESSPDWCLYIHPDGTGGCLFGQALLATAEIADRVSMKEGVSVSFLLKNLYDEGIIEDYLDVVETYGSWADTVQGEQDTGTPWGEAIRGLSD